MDLKEYISSGILELYVYGALSEEESHEVTRMLREHPEIRREVEEIESALLSLSGATAPYNPEVLLNSIKSKLSAKTRTVELPKRRTNWISYTGWAASLLLCVGLFFLLNDNNQLREKLTSERAKVAQMEQQIAEARDNVERTEELLAVLRSKNVSKIPLAGQAAAPDAYAAVYWDREENRAYIDGMELPEPPEGMVYQVWSLKLDPLTPTSIGLLDEFPQDKNKIFALENQEQSEAFGITLEPAGGSETPTMEQLYVLGTVS